MQVEIFGAGMAGLLAGNMLARRAPIINETATDLPNNHSAVLRFRSSVVGDVTGIPFREVSMIRTSVPWKNPVADALAYSFKNTGTRRSDRSISGGDVAAKRWIAPPDFIPRLAEDLFPAIAFGASPSYIGDLAKNGGSTIISTIPMPDLMLALEYPRMQGFAWAPAVNITARIELCDAFVSILVPDPGLPFSRISITGDRLTIEVPQKLSLSKDDTHQWTYAAAALLGIAPFDIVDIQASPSRYAKILPIDEDARREFISWATDTFNVFSLGRFATWRPGLLLDDLVADIRLIDRWIDRPARRYSLNKIR